MVKVKNSFYWYYLLAIADQVNGSGSSLKFLPGPGSGKKRKRKKIAEPQTLSVSETYQGITGSYE
jgi:hypothetical protein